jgi:P27 family predicted phage terminase small subunit
MRGRKPLSTELRLLHGNRSRRSVNTREPKHATIDAAIPPELADREGAPAWLAIARAEWERIVPSLVRTGHVQSTDRAVVLGYVTKYAQWCYFESEAAKGPPTIEGSTGNLVPHPLVKLAKDAYVLMVKTAIELGLSPSSRPRVVAAPSADPDPTDDFSKWQRRSPKR